jgi:hypothetical protein
MSLYTHAYKQRGGPRWARPFTIAYRLLPAS